MCLNSVGKLYSWFCALMQSLPFFFETRQWYCLYCLHEASMKNNGCQRNLCFKLNQLILWMHIPFEGMMSRVSSGQILLPALRWHKALFSAALYWLSIGLHVSNTASFQMPLKRHTCVASFVFSGFCLFNTFCLTQNVPKDKCNTDSLLRV